jgi:hypothetical protein
MKNSEKLLREFVQAIFMLHEEKPGGGLTDYGALRRVSRTDALAKGRSAIEATNGDIEKAAKELDIAPSTLYLAVQQEPSLEKSKERASDLDNSDKEKKKKEPSSSKLSNKRSSKGG